MIDFYGFTDPILVGKDRVILAGEGRWQAARIREMPTVPVIVFPAMTPAKYRAFRVAHNRIAEQSPWDERLLPLELQAIREEFEELPPVGYDDVDVDRLIASLAPPVEEKREVAFMAGQGDGDYRILVRCTTKRIQRETLERLKAMGYRVELA
jgi:ParB-like chromosome segregation protein Spo0J